MKALSITLLACIAVGSTAAAPATQPSATTHPAKDDTLDWLMGQATTAPSAAPASRPTAPFSDSDPKSKADQLGLRPGVIITSDGEKIRGRLSTTLDKPIRIWVEEKKEYRDVPFFIIKSVDAKTIWERDEKEWHFRESGSDIKEYSGKTYPAREMQYTVTLVNGQTVTGDIAAPIYLEMPTGDPKVFILHKRDKGEIGQTLKQLVYVQHVEFDGQ